MPLQKIQLGQAGLVGVFPTFCYLDTNDTMTEVQVPGYLNESVEAGFNFANGQLAVVSTRPTPDSLEVSSGVYQIEYDGVNWTLFPTISGIPIPVPLADGGTSASLVANDGAIFYCDATQGQLLAGTPTANQMLQSGSSSAPHWSTCTWPVTTTVNQILYSPNPNLVSGLATLDNGVLVTSALGVPEWLANGTPGYVLTAQSGAPPAWELGGLPEPTIPDAVLITDNSSNPEWLPNAGTTGYILTATVGEPPSWKANKGAGIAPTQQTFLSGSGTYTTPANCTYIRVVAVAGGGGGGGSGSGDGSGGNGGTTTFGSVISLGGGAGGTRGTDGGAGNVGGTPSITAIPGGLSVYGGGGGGGIYGPGTGNGVVNSPGGTGGNSMLGGGGASSGTSVIYAPDFAGGGGAGGFQSTLGYPAGGGGGGGSGCDVIIAPPLASYAYSVGVAGVGGTIGASGSGGFQGGSGQIVVYEFYS